MLHFLQRKLNYLLSKGYWIISQGIRHGLKKRLWCISDRDVALSSSERMSHHIVSTIWWIISPTAGYHVAWQTMLQYLTDTLYYPCTLQNMLHWLAAGHEFPEEAALVAYRMLHNWAQDFFISLHMVLHMVFRCMFRYLTENVALLGRRCFIRWQMFLLLKIKCCNTEPRKFNFYYYLGKIFGLWTRQSLKYGRPRWLVAACLIPALVPSPQNRTWDIEGGWC